MVQILQRLLLRFRGGQEIEEAAFDEILDRSFHGLRNFDPETDQQWLRLQRTIAQSHTKATTMKSRFTTLTGLIPRFALGVLVVAAALVGVYLYFSSTQRSPDTFATGKGEQREVVLGDGSKVILSYMTQLVVPQFQPGKPRRVSLTGEAYFRVQPSETPFIISTEYAGVQVVGTEFNLRARGGALEVAVIGGIVKVSAVKDGKDSTLLLSQHQMALCSREGFPTRIGDMSSPEYPGWMHGKIFLDRTPFLVACREIEMRFDITIKVSDSGFRSDIVTGILDAKTAESALAALCELNGRRFKHEGQTYTIY
jgi:transmembrane sensor